MAFNSPRRTDFQGYVIIRYQTARLRAFTPHHLRKTEAVSRNRKNKQIGLRQTERALRDKGLIASGSGTILRL